MRRSAFILVLSLLLAAGAYFGFYFLSAAPSRGLAESKTPELAWLKKEFNLSDAELELYDQYYELLSEQVPIPDLVIYLQAKPETLKKRIAKKNVPFEHRISDEYLEGIVKAYEHFFFHYKSSDLLVIETSEIDFIDRQQDLAELLERLSQPVKGTQYFLPLGSAPAD